MIAFAIAAALAAAVAFTAYRANALDRSGAVAAFCVGTAAFGAGGWPAAVVLFAFFASSVALSRVGATRKRDLCDIEKQGARDGWQVLANGGVAAVAIVLSLRLGAPLQAAFAGAFAAAAADTWGTEIGTLVRVRPRSILTFAPIATGLSGGITVLGCVAEVAGAMLVAFAAQITHVAAFWPVVIGGSAGALVDSLLGAGVQALRYCPSCEHACETDPHHCGSPTHMRRGFAWLQNDAVNLAATLTGAIVAGAMTRYRFM